MDTERRGRLSLTYLSHFKLDSGKATIYFPEKYINDIYGLDIKKETKEYIKETSNTGKSKPCIFEMKNADVLVDFSKVMQFKLIAI